MSSSSPTTPLTRISVLASRAARTWPVGHTGRVRSVYSGGIWAEDAHGWPLHLTSLAGVLGPFTAVLDLDRESFATAVRVLRPGETVSMSDGSLRLGPWSLDRTSALAWDPRPAWDTLSLRRTAWDFETETVNRQGPGATLHAWETTLDARLIQHAQAFQRALRLGDDDTLFRAAALLCGLGPGLTPAGDDYLSGYFLSTWAWAHPAPELARKILALARAQTNRLSCALLSAAADGEASEPWHRLVESWAGGHPAARERAAQAIRQTGHSSGRWCLAGFLDSLSVRKENQERGRPLGRPLSWGTTFPTVGD